MKKFILTMMFLLLTSASYAALTVGNIPQVKTGGSAPALQNSIMSQSSTTISVGGTLSATALSGPLSGNASTATALAADPADCGPNTAATIIGASGALTCSSIATILGYTPVNATTTVNGQALSGNVTVSTITGNAGTATALAANGTNCNAGYAPLGVDASGAVESCTQYQPYSANTTVLGSTIEESELNLTDLTTADFSTTKHGFVPKGTNLGKYLKDDGTWGTPSGSGAPSDADYLVVTANANLSAEIPIGKVDDTTIIANGTTWEAKSINDCQGTGKALTYTQSTNAYGCNTIAAGGDITTVGTCTTGDCGIEGGTDIFPFLYEGTPNTYETSFAVTDPTSDKTITFPDLTGTVALSTNKLSLFAATSSSELAGVLSDEDGTGTCGSGLFCIGGHTHPLDELSGGTAGANAYDFGGATSLEIPNTAGNVTVDAAGEIAVDSTNKQLAVFDSVEVAIPLRHVMYGPLFLSGAYDIETNYPLIELDATVYPNGIVITGWSISSSDADPTTELDANLRYSDAPGTGAFPGANEVLVDVLDTTTGNASEATMSSSDLGSGVIPSGKALYIDLDADPTDATAYWIWKMTYYIPES
jgi:hypothetical protein